MKKIKAASSNHNMDRNLALLSKIGQTENNKQQENSLAYFSIT